MQDFENLKVWQSAMDLAENCYKITTSFPDTEKFGLVSQIRRCSVSISSNIAEGCGRNSSKELLNFLRIANGSAAELLSQIILSMRLKFILASDGEKLKDKITEVKKMNYALQQKIIQNSF